MWVILALSIAVIWLINWLVNGNYGFWKARNVPFEPPKPFVGNMGSSLLFTKHLANLYAELYNKYQDCSWIGFYKLTEASMLIRDAELLKSITIKDFNCFQDNDIKINPDIDPLFGRNPFVLKGHHWKNVRSQITGAITTSKIKAMFTFIGKTSQDLVTYLNKEIENPQKDGVNAKELSTKFTTDVVAACAFGLDGNSFVDPNSEFRLMGEKLFRPTGFQAFKSLITFIFPKIGDLLRISFTSPEVESWFIGTLKQTIKYREENKIVRNDYLDIMLSLKNKSKEYEFTDMDVMAQAMTFYGDGMETSATALSFTLYELAKNFNVQEKLIEEIDRVLKKHGGEISYESVMDMPYLDMVISESLRMYPPVSFMMKTCTKQFTMPPPRGEGTGPGVVVESGMPLIIPTWSLHYDPQYYPEPEKFDPERFSEDRKGSIPRCAYMPFGEGPRQCLGFRFALTQIKAALVGIFANFEITVNSKTLPGFEFDPVQFITTKKGDIFVDFKKRAKQ